MSEKVLDIKPEEIDAFCAALQELATKPSLRGVVVSRIGNGFTSDHVLQGMYGPPREKIDHSVTRIISREGENLASYETTGKGKPSVEVRKVG